MRTKGKALAKGERDSPKAIRIDFLVFAADSTSLITSIGEPI